MPLTREQKESLVSSYTEGVAQSPHVILMQFEGITVPQVTELRAKVRESGGSYAVIKNRLALRAIAGAPLESLADEFRGATAAAWATEDPVQLAKVLTDFAKTVPAVQVKAGLVGGQQVAAEEIQEIASLPSREELVAKLLYLLQSPITRFVRTLAEYPRRLVVALAQIGESKGQGAGPAQGSEGSGE